jgi:hypothetical protein
MMTMIQNAQTCLLRVSILSQARKGLKETEVADYISDHLWSSLRKELKETEVVIIGGKLSVYGYPEPRCTHPILSPVGILSQAARTLFLEPRLRSTAVQ